MGQAVQGAGRGVRRGALVCALVAAGALLAAGLVYVRRPAQVVETVTTPARTPAPAPAPVYFAPQLPARDADVEQAGDRIAEAEVYLKKRQSAAALNALTHARRAAARALEARQRKGARPDALASALRELDAAQRSIERGAYEDAHRQLIALDKNLDHLDF